MDLRDEILLSLVAEVHNLVAIVDTLGPGCPEGLAGGLRIVRRLLLSAVDADEWSRLMQYFNTSDKPK